MSEGKIMALPLPTAEDTPERLLRAELTIVQLLADREDMKRTLRAWTIAIVVAMIGALGTMALAGLGAAVAYGELRQTAASNSLALQDIRAEVRALRQDAD